MKIENIRQSKHGLIVVLSSMFTFQFDIVENKTSDILSIWLLWVMGICIHIIYTREKLRTQFF